MAATPWINRGWLPTLLAFTMQAAAADKIQFSTPDRSTSPAATQPIPTVEIDLPQSNPVQAGTPGPMNLVVPPPTRTTTGPRVTDEEQRNWIFRDTQSEEGIRRALGIEVYVEEPLTGPKTVTSESVMRDYFNRQTPTPRFTPDTGGVLNNLSPSVSGGGPVPNQSFGAGTVSTTTRPSPGIGNDTFSTTLNSSSAVIRNHYRQVYDQQLSPINQALPEISTAGSPTPQQSRFQNLYQQSQAIDSQINQANKDLSAINDPLAPRTPEPVPETPFKASDVLEKRGGKILIPSRPF